MSAQPQIKKARTERMIVYYDQMNNRGKLSLELSEAKEKLNGSEHLAGALLANG